MFERFTRDAKRAVTAAIEEAGRRGDRSVGTEHLLIGVVATAAPGADLIGVSAETLRDAWADSDRAALEAAGVATDIDIESLSPGPRRGHIPFTDGAKQTLKDTLREALEVGSRRLDPEHMLIALTLRGPRDPAIRLLQQVDVSPDAVRRDLLEALQRSA